MPNLAEKAAIIARYGRTCFVCGIPLIRAEVRTARVMGFIWGLVEMRAAFFESQITPASARLRQAHASARQRSHHRYAPRTAETGHSVPTHRGAVATVVARCDVRERGWVRV
jgi:hypothetical protein